MAPVRLQAPGAGIQALANSFINAANKPKMAASIGILRGTSVSIFFIFAVLLTSTGFPLVHADPIQCTLDAPAVKRYCPDPQNPGKCFGGRGLVKCLRPNSSLAIGYMDGSLIPSASNSAGATFSASVVTLYGDYEGTGVSEVLISASKISCKTPRIFIGNNGKPAASVFTYAGCIEMCQEWVACDAAQPGGKPDIISAVCGKARDGKCKMAPACIAESFKADDMQPSKVEATVPVGADCKTRWGNQPGDSSSRWGYFARTLPAAACGGATKSSLLGMGRLH